MPGEMHKQLVEAARFPEYLQCFPLRRRRRRPPPTHKQAPPDEYFKGETRQIRVHIKPHHAPAHTREK
jgi:hypothetical protein